MEELVSAPQNAVCTKNIIVSPNDTCMLPFPLKLVARNMTPPLHWGRDGSWSHSQLPPGPVVQTFPFVLTTVTPCVGARSSRHATATTAITAKAQHNRNIA